MDWAWSSVLVVKLLFNQSEMEVNHKYTSILSVGSLLLRMNMNTRNNLLTHRLYIYLYD